MADLRSKWPTEKIAIRIPGPNEQPVVILANDDRMAMNLIRQHLKARGINASVTRAPDLPGVEERFQKALFRLVVWTDDKDRAEAIVEHLWPAEVRSRA